MKKFLFPVLALFVSAVFFSCKSTAVGDNKFEVKAYNLLSRDSSIYMSVPVKNFIPLTTKVLTATIDGLSESKGKMLAERFGMLYGGIGTVSDRSRIQVAAEGDFPSAGLNMILTKKNGFNKEVYVTDFAPESGFENQKLDYYNAGASPYFVSFPSTRRCLTAKDLDPLLVNYAKNVEQEPMAAIDWISQDSENILFYITRPGQYLRVMIGQTVNVACDSIFGSLSYSPDPKAPNKYSGYYDMTFYITMKNVKTTKAMMAALNLALGMMEANVQFFDEQTIMVSGIRVSEKQVSELFTRDPITGKHFSVQKDGQVIKQNVKNK